MLVFACCVITVGLLHGIVAFFSLLLISVCLSLTVDTAQCEQGDKWQVDDHLYEEADKMCSEVSRYRHFVLFESVIRCCF